MASSEQNQLGREWQIDLGAFGGMSPTWPKGLLSPLGGQRGLVPVRCMKNGYVGNSLTRSSCGRGPGSPDESGGWHWAWAEQKGCKNTITLLDAASAFPFLSTECAVSNTCYFCLEGYGLLLELAFQVTSCVVLSLSGIVSPLIFTWWECWASAWGVMNAWWLGEVINSLQRKNVPFTTRTLAWGK